MIKVQTSVLEIVQRIVSRQNLHFFKCKHTRRIL